MFFFLLISYQFCASLLPQQQKQEFREPYEVLLRLTKRDCVHMKTFSDGREFLHLQHSYNCRCLSVQWALCELEIQVVNSLLMSCYHVHVARCGQSTHEDPQRLRSPLCNNNGLLITNLRKIIKHFNIVITEYFNWITCWIYSIGRFYFTKPAGFFKWCNLKNLIFIQ